MPSLTYIAMIKIPQSSTDPWIFNVHNSIHAGASGKRKTAVSVYRLVENRFKRFFTATQGGKTVVCVKDGSYHNDGEYTTLSGALYALSCFLEDYLTESFYRDRIKRYFTDE